MEKVCGYTCECTCEQDCAFNKIDNMEIKLLTPDKQRHLKNMKSRYTQNKKKWYAVEYGGFWHIQDSKYYDNGGNLLDADYVGEEKAEANAKLAASAPVLLEALKRARQEIIELTDAETGANKVHFPKYIDKAIKTAI